MTTLIDYDKLNSANPKEKYGCAKVLIRIAQENPLLLYPDFPLWSEMLEHANNILKWTAIDLIGYLSAIDTENKINDLFPVLRTLLHGGQLITCNHAIFTFGLIGKNKPEYTRQVIDELLAIQNDTFDTDECKAIATGKVLDVFKSYGPNLRDTPEVLAFVREATSSRRDSTKKKAESLLKIIVNNDPTSR